MAVIINGNGIDMGNSPISNASQIDSTVINENGDNVATTSNLVGFKNYIINGNFNVWQRGTNFTSTGYTADRWYLPNGTASKIQDSYYNNIKVTGTALAQGIEFIGISQQGYFEIGKTFTLSWYAKNDSSFENITCYATFRNSVADSTNQVILFNNVGGGNLSTQWKRYSYTFTIDKSANNGNKCLEIGFYTPSGTNTYIRDVQMEEGSVATPFEQRPIGLELSLCQRYFQAIPNGVSFSADSNVFSGYQPNNAFPLGRKYLLPVTMRVNPTTQYVELHTGYNGTPTIAATKTILTIALNPTITALVNYNPFIYVYGITLDAEL